MLCAHNQADQSARALPAEEGRPPFMLVVDVGRNIELYAESTRSGATYTPFPDARSHRIRLEDLRDPASRDHLCKVWIDPMALDPARRSARIAREIADQLALLKAAALAYEQQGKEAVAEVCAFHHHLCEVRVLDHACGSGNFLYVTLEHMKRLEGEVLKPLHDPGESKGLLELEGVTVDPHQYRGWCCAARWPVTSSPCSGMRCGWSTTMFSGGQYGERRRRLPSGNKCWRRLLCVGVGFRFIWVGAQTCRMKATTTCTNLHLPGTLARS